MYLNITIFLTLSYLASPQDGIKSVILSIQITNPSDQLSPAGFSDFSGPFRYASLDTVHVNYFGLTGTSEPKRVYPMKSWSMFVMPTSFCILSGDCLTFKLDLSAFFHFYHAGVYSVQIEKDLPTGYNPCLILKRKLTIDINDYVPGSNHLFWHPYQPSAAAFKADVPAGNFIDVGDDEVFFYVPMKSMTRRPIDYTDL